LLIVLLPSAVHVGGVVVIVGTAGTASAAALLKAALIPEEQLPASVACTV
jgi:hypothetical protein